MQSYGAFAFWYDMLNSAADYGRLAQTLHMLLCRYGVPYGTVADLGCGTGELLFRLAKKGYELIGIDSSPEMLSVLRQKAEEQQQAGLLLLCQPLEHLDLYGTVQAAISTFDTFNHLTARQIEQMLRRLFLFIDPGGLLLFDVNTPYKNKYVLQNRKLVVEAAHVPDVHCVWHNRLAEEEGFTEIEIEVYSKGKQVACQRFREYIYSLARWEEMLSRHSFVIREVLDGECFSMLRRDSERAMIVAQRGN